MLQIAICDDWPEQAECIRAVTQDYFSRYTKQTAKIHIYYNALLFLENLKNNGGFDILLLDICMPGISGIDVAQEIRKRGDKSEIIFLTASDEFAVDAFALKAAHYLLKPFTKEQFDEAMDRAIARFTAEAARKILLKLAGGGTQQIDINDILYMESFSHTQNIHFKNGCCVGVRQTMTQLNTELSQISPRQFASPCKGYLVNHKAIRTVESKQLVLQDGKCLPISRGNFREFQERYFDYMFSEGRCR